jgi:hypothetical protein
VDLPRHHSSQAGVAARPVTATSGSIRSAGTMGGEAEFLRDHPQVQPSGGQASSLPATTSSVTSAASPPSLYLVGSTEQAQEVQQGLDQVRAAIGWQPLDATVLTVAPEASPDEVTWLLSTLNESRRLQGLRPVQLVDLRPAATAAVPTTSVPADPQLLIAAYQGRANALDAAGMPGQAAAVSDLPAFWDVPSGTSVTVYLVGTQAEADAISAGPPAVARSVIVVADAAGEAQAQATIAWQNTMRALVGLAPLTVVDLRTPDATAVPPQSPPSCPEPDVVPYSGIC